MTRKKPTVEETARTVTTVALLDALDPPSRQTTIEAIADALRQVRDGRIGDLDLLLVDALIRSWRYQREERTPR